MASETSLSNPQPDELEGWIWSQFQDGELQDSAKFMEHELTGHEASLLNGDVAEIEPSSTVQTPSNPNSVPFLAEAQRLRTTLCPNEQLLRKLVARVQTLEQKLQQEMRRNEEEREKSEENKIMMRTWCRQLNGAVQVLQKTRRRT